MYRVYNRRFFNGKKVGTTPWVNKELPIGEYNVEVRQKNYKPLKRTISINEDQEVLIYEKLEPTQYGRLLLRAGQGNTLAIRLLADLYRYGIDEIVGGKIVTSWLDDCVEDNTWTIKIEDLQKENVKIEKDLSQEIYWTQKLVSIKYDDCAKFWLEHESYHLMECFLVGNDIKQDFSQSFYWAKVSSELWVVGSGPWIAWHFFYGRGVKKDVNQALSWLNKSVEYAGKRYNECTSEILKKVIINDQAEWMDKDILRLLNND